MLGFGTSMIWLVKRGLVIASKTRLGRMAASDTGNELKSGVTFRVRLFSLLLTIELGNLLQGLGTMGHRFPYSRHQCNLI